MSRLGLFPRAVVAAHEAGHTAIAWRFETRPYAATLNPLKYAGLAHCWGTTTGISVLAFARVYLAGGLAEEHLGRLLGLGWFDRVRGVDLEETNRYLSTFSARERFVFEEATRAQVERDWPWISQLAMSLFQRTEIDATEIARIMNGPGDTSSPTWFERHCRLLLSSITQGESVCEVLHTAATDILGPSPRPDGTGD